MLIVWIAKILAALNANTRSGEIGAAIALGLLMALIPAGNLLWLALFVLSFFLRINNAMFLVFLGLFKLVAGVFDPLSDAIGYAILRLDALGPLFLGMANLPFLPWTNFNHSLVMGGLVLGLLGFIPVALVGSWLVRQWRSGAREKLANLKAVKAFLKWPLVSTLAKFFGKILTVAQEFV